jgi:hypothetical protein
VSGAILGDGFLVSDLRLYRTTHKTFEAYCQERWGWTKSYTNNLIQAADVNEDLTTMVVKPTSERQSRPLAKLPKE